MFDIIAKLKDNNLLGRGGGEFPTGQKWELVKSAKADKKFVICNASEGEPGVFKDGFILENYQKDVVKGIKIALETMDNSSGYIYLKEDYYRKFKKSLKEKIRGAKIELFKKNVGYIGGEETTLINVIEQKRPEPRQKPPFPTTSGLFGYPTLINNVETFYCVARISEDLYRKTRFYSVSGDVKKKGVFELPINYSARRILEETGNLPDFDFFVQLGGGASGEIFLPSELDRPVCGAGAIIVYNKKKTKPMSLLKKWADFFMKENCDKCVPCREGTFRIVKIFETNKIDAELLNDLFFALRETSFCPFGKAVPLPFSSLIKKIITPKNEGR